MTCKRCGVENANSAGICRSCGAELVPIDASQRAHNAASEQPEALRRARHEYPSGNTQQYSLQDMMLEEERTTRTMHPIHAPGSGDADNAGERINSAQSGTGHSQRIATTPTVNYKSLQHNADYSNRQHPPDAPTAAQSTSRASTADAQSDSPGHSGARASESKPTAHEPLPTKIPKNSSRNYTEADMERDLHDIGYRVPRTGVNIAMLVAAALIIIATLFMCWATFTGSGQRWKAAMGLNAPASAYWDVGRDCYNAQDYAGAVNYFESALRRDPDNYEGLLNLAQALETNGNYDRAKRAYLRAISVRPEQLATYTRIISLMNSTGASDAELAEIYSLAYKNTGDVTFADSAAQYTPGPVRASYASGDYSYELDLQLASDIGATIYYTLDGSAPDAGSNVYSGPITLSQGVYTLRAVATAGEMTGPELTCTYNIYLPVVEAPSFASKPGKYQSDDDRKSILVNVPAGATVYYTTNGDAPSTRSEMYDEGISLREGTYTIRMIAVSSGGQVSEEISAEYTIIGELPEPFGPDDRFKSFKVGVTTRAEVNDRFTNLLNTIGDTELFFTQVYNFGEADFTVIGDTAIVTAVRIINSDITGVRGTEVGWKAESVIAEFRDENYPARNNERILYALSDDRHGWLSYSDEDTLTGIHYIYTDSNNLVELNFTIEDGIVAAMEYMISSM